MNTSSKWAISGSRHAILGPAHSPGDIVIWLPDQSLVISGDMAFHERMLPIFEDTITSDWLETWDTEFEALKATYVIPGHGHPTNMDQVRRYTKGYLEYLRGKIADHLDSGGGLAEAYYVDQSPYANLDTFEELATKNAGRVFEQMEFDECQIAALALARAKYGQREISQHRANPHEKHRHPSRQRENGAPDMPAPTVRNHLPACYRTPSAPPRPDSVPSACLTETLNAELPRYNRHDGRAGEDTRH